MRLEITPELAELRPTVRRFVTERLEPVAQEIDRSGRIPDEAWRLMRERGWLGMLLPPDYGGGGTDLATYCLVMEEVARSHRIFTLLMDYTSGLTPVAIHRHGTEAQKRRWLRGLADGTLVLPVRLPTAPSNQAHLEHHLADPSRWHKIDLVRHPDPHAPGGWRYEAHLMVLTTPYVSPRAAERRANVALATTAHSGAARDRCCVWRRYRRSRSRMRSTHARRYDARRASGLRQRFGCDRSRNRSLTREPRVGRSTRDVRTSR